ncbi:Poly(U)-specific endoribonuclease-B [Bagarius yarrelli]|uniref:Uridylate-specific endoribonuclease n=1 Tax=Bagarius yarrelli TaxID=175774 RepID=A0A556VVJ5_BAGYA|nr:Poly(U)-specific endoribonuclease-B [Bagarius yarrelli]
MIEHDPELVAVVQELWDNDINRLRPGTDYRISLQILDEETEAAAAAASPLFTYVDETILKKETFSGEKRGK